MRRAAATDANQAEIAAALRAAGCLVLSLHQIGGGAPDILVGRCWSLSAGGVDGTLHLLEIKRDARAAKRKGRTADAQRDFRQRWPVHVVTSVEEALRAVGLKVA